MTAAVVDHPVESALSSEEAALYDRQIRLWGAQAQGRMKNGHVVVCGMKGITAEVCKNIVLAGIGKLTIVDSETVTSQDLLANFLISTDSVGQNKASASLERLEVLNPRVSINIITTSIFENKDILDDCHVLLATNFSKSKAIDLNNECRARNIKFFFADTFGYYGFTFVDLDQHHFIEDQQQQQQSNENSVEKKTINFSTLNSAFDSDYLSTLSKRNKKSMYVYLSLIVAYEFRNKHGRWATMNETDVCALKDIKQSVLEAKNIGPSLVTDEVVIKLATNHNISLSPVCAIVGGIIGQEILKSLTCLAEPLKNFFFYDGYLNLGTVHDIS